jgi:hypothetical protein
VADGWATMAPEPHMEAVREREADAGWLREADWVSAVNSANEERTSFSFFKEFSNIQG